MAAALAVRSALSASLNVDLPCAPACFVGEPCPVTSPECMAERTRVAATRAWQYVPELVTVATLPVAVAVGMFVARPSRPRLPVAVAYGVTLLPLVQLALVLFQTGLGGTPGPWLQSR